MRWVRLRRPFGLRSHKEVPVSLHRLAEVRPHNSIAAATPAIAAANCPIIGHNCSAGDDTAVAQEAKRGDIGGCDGVGGAAEAQGGETEVIGIKAASPKSLNPQGDLFRTKIQISDDVFGGKNSDK